MSHTKRLIEEQHTKPFDLNRYLEFYYEVVQYLTITYHIEGSVGNQLIEKEEYYELYQLAKEWANEMYHSINEIDRSKWLDAVDAFLIKKQEMK